MLKTTLKNCENAHIYLLLYVIKMKRTAVNV